MQSNDAPMKIERSDLARYRKTVGVLITRAEHVVRTHRKAVGYAGGGGPTSVKQHRSLIEIATKISGDETPLLADMINHALHVVQQGMEIGLHVAELYKRASGLDTLVKQQRASGGFKDDATRAQFQEKNQTQAHIMRFVTAHAILYELSDYRLDVVDSVVLPEMDTPDLDYSGMRASASSMLFYFAAALEDERVHTPEAVVRMTRDYFKLILDDVKMRADNMRHTEPFTERAYQLEGTEFIVHGFEVAAKETSVSAEFSRLSYDDIVGNSVAKHESRRMVQRTLCYDSVTQRNPFRELTGRMQTVRLGHGVPGTGKSMQIKASATYFQDMCDMIGIPFVFHPLPGTIVSTFQGGSAERMEQWFKTFHDPRVIVYAPIDDAEQVLQDRTMQGVSAGVREIISQFLTGTEGAGATWVERGMGVIEVFTNLPEQIDPAVLSRFQARFPINGARRWEDFLDQDHLWWRAFADTMPDFVSGMTLPTDYELMSLQAELQNLGSTLEHYTEPKNATMNTIYNRVLRDHAVTEYKFFAALAHAVQQEFPGFSSRETRNIQSAVSARMVDFDFPEQWMEEPEVFFRQDYDTKTVLLKDAMHNSMGGLKLQDIWVQEVSRYLDSFAEIAEKQFRRDVEAEKKRWHVAGTAKREYGAEQAALHGTAAE